MSIYIRIITYNNCYYYADCGMTRSTKKSKPHSLNINRSTRVGLSNRLRYLYFLWNFLFVLYNASFLSDKTFFDAFSIIFNNLFVTA